MRSTAPITPTEPAVLGYVRVSTEDQAREGVSLDEQRRRIHAYVEAHGLTLGGIESDEGISGKTLRARPGLLRALDAVETGTAAGIVVVKLDRLSRTTTDILSLVAQANRQGWQLHSIQEHLDTQSANGRFVVGILSLLSQMERETTAERTRYALAHLRSQGKRTSGRAPWGYRFEDGREVPVAAERAILARMQAIKAEGNGAQRIAKALTREGIGNPRTGRSFTRGTVEAILRTAARRAAIAPDEAAKASAVA